MLNWIVIGGIVIGGWLGIGCLVAAHALWTAYDVSREIDLLDLVIALAMLLSGVGALLFLLVVFLQETQGKLRWVRKTTLITNRKD